jgi:transcriptional regulator
MFAHPAFRIEDHADVCAFIRARRFATLVLAGPDGPEAAHLPMLLRAADSGDGLLLEGHLRRAHPVLALAARGAPALAIFHGGDGYVSPSLYPSKQAHGMVVPTWNYIAAEVRGQPAVFADPADLRRHLGAITDAMEKDAPAPWAVADAPDAYVSQMMAAISGVRITVTHVEGVRKLSQNRAEPDRAGVEQGFRASADPTLVRLADQMPRPTPYAKGTQA